MLETASLYLSYVNSYLESKKYSSRGFPGGAVVENLPANAGDTGSSPGLGRSHMPRSNWAQLLRGMWDLPRPGLDPVSPALAGGFSTTAPPGKPH